MLHEAIADDPLSAERPHPTLAPPPAGASAAPGLPPPPTLKVVVAVHGIGEQRRCETVRAVAERFARDLDPPLPLMPLGHFHVADAAEVAVAELGDPDAWRDEPGTPDARRHVYFAEVYWAHIPRAVVREADTLEDARAWGRTVVSRARELYRHVQPDARDEDFDLAAGAVEEVVEAVEVMDNLLAVAARAGVFRFDLAPLLRDYVGDVQLVADFPAYRARILHRFHQVMAGIDAAVEARCRRMAAELVLDGRCDSVQAAAWADGIRREIHLVAHSEGTVVAFLGLLQALQGVHPVVPDGGPKPSLDWARRVRGFMTLGSPIDKHLVLWPRMWDGLGPIDPPPGGPIAWRNYYDLGDPIGFQLETAREWMTERGIRAFDFGPRHDIGFARYPLPGKAHVDYWKDREVFRHFIDGVVLRDSRSAPPAPASRAWARAAGIGTSFGVPAAFHLVAVYFLYGAVAMWLDTKHVTTLDTVVNVTVLTLLLCGVTVAARLPRLVDARRRLWRMSGLLALVAAAAPLLALAPDHPTPVLVALGEVLRGGPQAATVGAVGIVALSLLPASSGWWAPRRPRHGRRWLVGLGAAVVALLSALVMLRPGVGGVPPDAPLWPVVLAFGLFVYAWWVGILTFDLAFLWHRYIRHAAAKQALSRWHRQDRAQRDAPRP